MEESTAKFHSAKVFIIRLANVFYFELGNYYSLFSGYF